MWGTIYPARLKIGKGRFQSGGPAAGGHSPRAAYEVQSGAACAAIKRGMLSF